jgi:DNA polymerase delta subunit 4
VGITRKARWLRAQRLGLSPPIEVLAVMLKEEAKGVEGIQRSSFDDILNAPVVA